MISASKDTSISSRIKSLTARVAMALVISLASARSDVALAQACTAEQVANAVDEAGANLRRITQETQPKLEAKIKQLKAQRGWSDAEAEERAYVEVSDKRTGDLDTQANELLAKIDQLGAVTPNNPPTCSRMQELETASLELQATVRAKATYMLGRFDGLLGEIKPADSKSASAPAVTAPATAPVNPAPKAAPAQKSATVAPPSPAPAPAVPPAAVPPPAPWSTTTTANDPPQALPPGGAVDDGYTIEEIKLASTGLFGKLSSGLGEIVEHAFGSAGKPTGYILGNEGGGAFLAGLRYGSGTLYLRSGGTMPIYWHGPSLGTDIGASGSKVMFLVYRMRHPDEIVNSFSGVEGSAYLVGGIGFTLMTNGTVQMAPIRSGIGLRLGANVGYVRFTRKPTWNPF
jgi:hypothetical protein